MAIRSFIRAKREGEVSIRLVEVGSWKMQSRREN